jgi:hypothetical protein
MMEPSGLGAKLIRSRSSVSLGVYDRSAAGSLFVLGLRTFVLGEAFGSLDTRTDPSHQGQNKLNREDWIALVYAILNTVGLLIMTSADLDVNSYFAKTKKLQTRILLFVWACTYAIIFFSRPGRFFAPVLLVFLCLAAWFSPIIEMKKGYPPMTEVFTLILALELVGWGGKHILVEVQEKRPVEEWPWPNFVILFLIGPVSVLYAYYWARRKNESQTISFYTAAFTYLFMIGIEALSLALWNSYYLRMDQGEWALGMTTGH